MKIKDLTTFQKFQLAKIRIKNDPQWWVYNNIEFSIKLSGDITTDGYGVIVSCDKFADQPIFISMNRFYLNEVEFLFDNDLLYKD